MFLICINCDKEFERSHKLKCCSPKCKFEQQKGKPPWNKGKKIPQLKGEKHGEWKGENASYRVKHLYIEYNYGKATHCENPKCIYPRKSPQGKLMLTPKRFHWANISKTYKREREDWIQLCVSCHKLYDNGKLNLYGSKKSK